MLQDQAGTDWHKLATMYLCADSLMVERDINAPRRM